MRVADERQTKRENLGIACKLKWLRLVLPVEGTLSRCMSNSYSNSFNVALMKWREGMEKKTMKRPKTGKLRVDSYNNQAHSYTYWVMFVYTKFVVVFFFFRRLNRTYKICKYALISLFSMVTRTHTHTKTLIQIHSYTHRDKYTDSHQCSTHTISVWYYTITSSEILTMFEHSFVWQIKRRAEQRRKKNTHQIQCYTND